MIRYQLLRSLRKAMFSSLREQGSRGSMLKILFAILAIFLVASDPVWARPCTKAGDIIKNEPEKKPSSLGWKVNEKKERDAIRSNFYAEHPDHPGLTIPLKFEVGENHLARVLEWHVLKRYNNRVGLLQYHGNSQGTSFQVLEYYNAIVDIKEMKVLGYGIVMTDGAGGRTLKEYQVTCERAKWFWFDDSVVIHNEGSDTTVLLPPARK